MLPPEALALPAKVKLSEIKYSHWRILLSSVNWPETSVVCAGPINRRHLLQAERDITLTI